MRTYKKPVVSVDAGMTEGVYAASGAAQGTLNVTYIGVWDKWGTNGEQMAVKDLLWQTGPVSTEPLL